MSEANISLTPFIETPDSIVTDACREFARLQDVGAMLQLDAIPGSTEEKANDEVNHELYCREWIVASSIADARASTLEGHRARAIVCNRAREFLGPTWLESDVVGIILAALVRDLVAAQ